MIRLLGRLSVDLGMLIGRGGRVEVWWRRRGVVCGGLVLRFLLVVRHYYGGLWPSD